MWDDKEKGVGERKKQERRGKKKSKTKKWRWMSKAGRKGGWRESAKLFPTCNRPVVSPWERQWIKKALDAPMEESVTHNNAMFSFFFFNCMHPCKISTITRKNCQNHVCYGGLDRKYTVFFATSIANNKWNTTTTCTPSQGSWGINSQHLKAPESHEFRTTPFDVPRFGWGMDSCKSLESFSESVKPLEEYVAFDDFEEVACFRRGVYLFSHG